MQHRQLQTAMHCCMGRGSCGGLVASHGQAVQQKGAKKQARLRQGISLCPVQGGLSDWLSQKQSHQT